MNERPTVEHAVALLDRVLVESEVDGSCASFQAVIVRICPTELWLSLASPDERLGAMLADQSVRLTVSRGQAALVSQSKFRRLLDGDKMRDFAATWPGALERVQRRAHVRYRIDWPVHFRRTDPATGTALGEVLRGTALNISAGGLLFASDTPVSVDEELELTLPLYAGDGLKMHGVVVRAREAGEDSSQAGEPGRIQSAVRFTRMSSPEQERILRFIRLTEHRRAVGFPSRSFPAGPDFHG
jgi:c-di-GMP-binding flagellar brake protein YcgR